MLERTTSFYSRMLRSCSVNRQEYFANIKVTDLRMAIFYLFYRPGLKLRIILEVTPKFILSYLNKWSDADEMVQQMICILICLRSE